MNEHEPSGNELSRRQAGGIIAGTLLGAGLAAGLSSSVIAFGQQPGGKGGRPPAVAPKPADPATAVPPPKSILTGVLTAGNTRDWLLKPVVHVSSYQEDASRTPQDRMPTIGNLTFKTAAVLFPVIRATASSKTDIDRVKGELTFNDRPIDVKPDYNEAYHASARFGRWEMKDQTGRECELKLQIPMTCWQTVFNERLASKAQWPDAGKWGKVGASTLGPQLMVDQDAEDAAALRDLVKKWTEGKSPQSVPPLLLAKTFAARMVEQFQTSGNGESFGKLGTFIGLDLQRPSRTIKSGRGSQHDIAAVLLGAYRAAGLPARLVIGYDGSEQNGDSTVFDNNNGANSSLRSWVEFCLFDAATDTEVWVPVDVVKIRARSSRVGRLEDPWKYFGTHEELDDVLPFAHHYLPPTTVISYGYAFWGWFTTPQSQIASHFVRFTASTPSKRAATKPSKNEGKKPE